MNLLADLVALSEREGLLTPFHEVRVDRTIVLGRNGFVRTENSARKILAPVVKRSGPTLKPYDGYDNEAYVLGMGDSDVEFAAFWDRQEELSAAAGDNEALKAVRAARHDESWISRMRVEAHAILDKKKAIKHVMFALAVGEELLVARPKIRRYFEQSVGRVACAAGLDTCLVTGESCTAARLHDNIQGVPGSGAGFPLVSFNQPTSIQGGLGGPDKGARGNFPTSPYVVRSYVSALNHLLAAQRFDVGPSTCGVVWGPPSAGSVAEVIGCWTKQEALGKAWKEIEVLSGSDDKLHVLFLKGSKGRVAIIGYDVLQAAAAATALLRFRTHFAREWRTEGGNVQVVEPSLLSRLRAVSEATPSEVLDEFTRVRVVEDIVLGRNLPEYAIRRIIGPLAPMDIADRDSEASARKSRYRAAKAQLEWFEFYGVVGGVMKKGRSDMTNDTTLLQPTLEDYGLSTSRPGPGDPGLLLFDFITIGRLISLEETIKREAHGRNIIGGSSLQMVNVNLSVWYQDHFRRMRTYVEKLQRAGRKGTAFTRMAEDAAAQIGDIANLARTSPMSTKERAAVLWGYTKQDAYARQYRRWRAEDRQRKEAEGHASQ